MNPTLISYLSAAAAAVWSVWTWQADKQKVRDLRRDEMSAQYVNTLIVASQELQSRLYKILEENELSYYQNQQVEPDAPASPYAIDTLYHLSTVFGWGLLTFRYGPYTRDSRMIAMMARMDAILESRNLFPGDAFRFTLNQRVALGDAIVRRVADTNAGPSFRYVTRFAFEEDMVNPQSERARLFRCATVKQTLKAVDRAIGGEPLEGRERLAALQNLLVDMLHYLESQEGFHTSLGARRRAKCAPIDPGCIEFGGNQMHVVHKIPGRVRISVPAIRKNKRSAIRLQNELSAQSHIVSASVNESTGSLIIEYSADIAEPELLQLLNQKLQNYS